MLDMNSLWELVIKHQLTVRNVMLFNQLTNLKNRRRAATLKKSITRPDLNVHFSLYIIINNL